MIYKASIRRLETCKEGKTAQDFNRIVISLGILFAYLLIYLHTPELELKKTTQKWTQTNKATTKVSQGTRKKAT
jgi:hypothetical protein